MHIIENLQSLFPGKLCAIIFIIKSRTTFCKLVKGQPAAAENPYIYSYVGNFELSSSLPSSIEERE